MVRTNGLSGDGALIGQVSLVAFATGWEQFSATPSCP